ncbi:hypothetical protein P8935_19060 [Telmatobacter sp. DSM 110680]|uniref:Photosynthesis system II assembly factor Ycf48/Hcf136-like domain-containing protein n=1 Tax=Telmatobacter sp. DSM 110680 TaxID=3036704 RepID=A0AAU7DH77_9BACT
MRTVVMLLAILAVTPVHGQWTLETSNTTADLRGIHSIGNGIAWASGTNGTVLRTEDGGYVWQSCTVPPGAEKLDFRGIQAFDANTAIVMSSGKGDLSRLYKTTDGCHSWNLIFTNPDKDGFWDAIVLNRFDKDGELLGDPVSGKFALWETEDKGMTWERVQAKGLDAGTDEGAFAASNSSLLLDESFGTGFVTGGPVGARIFYSEDTSMRGMFSVQHLPLSGGSPASGAFSIENREWCCWVAVGGDYTKPNLQNLTAAFTHDGGKSWTAAKTQPQGYRSAVAYESASKTWVTVGPNGTDISSDDGKNWRALRPDAARHEAADADRNWNALSLPFVVGPHGRIGKLNDVALKH